GSDPPEGGGGRGQESPSRAAARPRRRRGGVERRVGSSVFGLRATVARGTTRRIPCLVFLRSYLASAYQFPGGGRPPTPGPPCSVSRRQYRAVGAPQSGHPQRLVGSSWFSKSRRPCWPGGRLPSPSGKRTSTTVRVSVPIRFSERPPGLRRIFSPFTRPLSQQFPLNLSCEKKTICNILFGNWLWQQPRSSYCTLSMLLVL